MPRQTRSQFQSSTRATKRRASTGVPAAGLELHASLHRVVYVCFSTGNVMEPYKTISGEMGLPA